MDTPPLVNESANTAITSYMICLAREERTKNIDFLLALRAAKTCPIPKTFKDVANLPVGPKKKWLVFMILNPVLGNSGYI